MPSVSSDRSPGDTLAHANGKEYVERLRREAVDVVAQAEATARRKRARADIVDESLYDPFFDDENGEDDEDEGQRIDREIKEINRDARRFIKDAIRKTRLKIAKEYRKDGALHKVAAYRLFDYIYRALEKEGFPDEGVSIPQERLVKAAEVKSRQVERLLSEHSSIIERIDCGRNVNRYRINLILDDNTKALWNEWIRMTYATFEDGYTDWCSTRNP